MCEPRGEAHQPVGVGGREGAARSTFQDAALMCWLLSGSSAGPRAESLGSLPRLPGLSYNTGNRLQSEPFLRLGLRKGVQHPFQHILAIGAQIAGKKT